MMGVDGDAPPVCDTRTVPGRMRELAAGEAVLHVARFF